MNHQLKHTNFPGQPYILNSTESVIPVNIAPAGEEAVWLYNRLRRPSTPELLVREQESTTETKPIAGGESLIITNDREANIKLFKKIMRGVRGLTRDDQEQEASESLIAKLNSGWMNKAVQGYYAGAARLRWNREMAYTDSDPNQALLVDHEFGTQELPDYIVTWKFKKPDEIVMADFRLNAQKISTGGGGRRAKSKLITDLTVAIRTFREIFDGVEGAVIAVPKAEGSEGFDLIEYSAERREDFINSIDAVIQRDAVQVVMDYMEGQLQD
jgi:hypothetical protein